MPGVTLGHAEAPNGGAQVASLGERGAPPGVKKGSGSEQDKLEKQTSPQHSHLMQLVERQRCGTSRKPKLNLRWSLQRGTQTHRTGLVPMTDMEAWN